MGFGTKKVTETVKEGGNFVSKKITPGNHRCKVNGIYTKEIEDKKKGGTKLQLFLTLETQPIGGDFKGWALDKDDESKGFALGQIGNVKSNPFGYKTEKKDGKEYVREESIAKFLHILCLEANGSTWVQDVDGKYETFEEFIEAFNQNNPIKDVYLDWCIGGQKSINEQGYADYWLNIPLLKKGERGFKNPNKLGNLAVFDQVLHIYDPENQTLETGFSAAPIAKEEPKQPKWNDEDEDDMEFAPVATSEEKTDDDPFAIDVEADDTDPFDIE